jgi:DNA-binding NarL/FixJ family response regulator
MIRVLIADDHAVVRAGTRELLESTGDIKVVAEASDGKEAVSEFKRTLPDVAILDISMPVMDGIDTCKQLRMLYPDARILILTVHPEEQYAVRLLKAGALGYATKKASAQELQEAVFAVARNEAYLPPGTRSLILDQLVNIKDNDNPLERFSNRELQVFNQLIQGKKLKEIADSLYLSPKTVDTYRSRILQKLGLKRTVDLLTFAHQHSLI